MVLISSGWEHWHAKCTSSFVLRMTSHHMASIPSCVPQCRTITLCLCLRVRLKDALRAQVATAEAQGDVRRKPGQRMRLVICADATPMWRTSATRCDVFLDIRQTARVKPEPPVFSKSLIHRNVSGSKMFSNQNRFDTSSDRSLWTTHQLVHLVDLGRRRRHQLPSGGGCQSQAQPAGRRHPR